MTTQKGFKLVNFREMTRRHMAIKLVEVKGYFSEFVQTNFSADYQFQVIRTFFYSRKRKSTFLMGNFMTHF